MSQVLKLRLSKISAWLLTTNGGFFALAFLLFFANQLLEFFILRNLGKTYSDLCAWDCGWYSSIINRGYDLGPQVNIFHLKDDAANWAFFPALPLVASFVKYITNMSEGLALILSSKFFFLLSIFTFIKFCKDYSPNVSAIIAGAVVAFNPYSIYGNVGYTESMFLFFTCICFSLMKRERYLACGAIGGILTSVRLAGIFTLLSYASSAFKKFLKSQTERRLEIFLGFIMMPLGLCVFMMSLYVKMGDALAFLHIQRAWGKSFHNPVMQIYDGLKSGLMFNEIVCVTTIVALLFSVRMALKKRYELALFSVFCTIIPITTSLASMPRYIWWQAPILLSIAELVCSGRYGWILCFPAFIFGLIFFYCSWFSGLPFVI